MLKIGVGDATVLLDTRTAFSCCGATEVGSIRVEGTLPSGGISGKDTLGYLLNAAKEADQQCASFVMYDHSYGVLDKVFISPAVEDKVDTVVAAGMTYNVYVSEEFYNPNSGNMLRMLFLSLADTDVNFDWDEDEEDHDDW